MENNDEFKSEMELEKQAFEDSFDNQEKPLTRKEKRIKKLRDRYLNPVDIKFQGPLSYRILRIIGWVSLAFAQIVMLNSFSTSIFNWDPLGNWGTLLNLLGSFSTPLFIVASFGLILSGQKKYRDVVIMYGAGFLGIALGFCIFYLRYINGLFVKLGIEQTQFFDVVDDFASDRVQVNVFADLFSFSAFHLFVNYNPKNHFKNKKIIFFRLFAILPVLYIIGAYVVKVLSGLRIIDTPFYVYPFLTTKSPLVFFVFALVSLWIKNREKLFLKLGATKEQYHDYLKTNRNSLSVSFHISLAIVLAAIIELFVVIALVIYLIGIKQYSQAATETVMNVFGVGQTASLVLTIPFIMLYSYKKKHKKDSFDIIIPLAGIGLIALVYVEGIYQFLTHFVN